MPTLILIIVVGGAIIGPFVVGNAAYTIDPSTRLGLPSAAHLLGTDELGRDLLSRLLVGSQVSLIIGVAATVVACFVGGGLGLVSGFLRGAFDFTVMRLMDILLGFPAILLILLLLVLFGGSEITLIAALALVAVPVFARMMRAPALTVANLPFILVTRSIGASRRRILFLHVLPSCMGPLIVQFTLSVSYSILFAASISYLGLGIQPPTPSLGNLINDGQGQMLIDPWLIIPPSIVLIGLIGALNILGERLGDTLLSEARVA